jgi:hypothetical protein
MVVRACVSVHVREHVRVQACEAGSWCVEPLVRALSVSSSSSSSSSSLLLLLLLLSLPLFALPLIPAFIPAVRTDAAACHGAAVRAWQGECIINFAAYQVSKIIVEGAGCIPVLASTTAAGSSRRCRLLPLLPFGFATACL